MHSMRRLCRSGSELLEKRFNLPSTLTFQGQPALRGGCSCHGLCHPDVLLFYELPDDIQGRLDFSVGKEGGFGTPCARPRQC